MNEIERVAYPTLIAEHEGAFLVYVPDFNIYTEGKDVLDAIAMARDAIGLKGIDYEDDCKQLPNASSYDEAMKKAESVKDIFDYTKGNITLVDVNLSDYRKKMMNRAVKKNCTIPYWLCAKAEEAGVNFSQLLQDALKSKLRC